MNEIWKRIDTWLNCNAPDIYRNLGEPATTAQIAAAEQMLGATLPADLRLSYFIHNGQFDRKQTLLGSMWHLLSLDHALREWRHNNQLLDRGYFFDNNAAHVRDGRPIWWSKNWLPIAANGAGDFVCVDLGASAYGQVLIHWHDANTPDYVAPDFHTWLRRFADELERNRYSVFAQGLVRDTDAWVAV